MTSYLHRYIFPAAHDLLPEKMASKPADAMLVAIALQESECAYRAQVRGPAKGFWQFEQAGVTGVMSHPASRSHTRTALVALRYSPSMTTPAIHDAIEHNDVLACVFARLLLWTLPEALPAMDEPGQGWSQYLKAWRPGKPHIETWHRNFTRAWALVNA